MGVRKTGMAEAIALIDYGAGNLHSVKNALLAAGAPAIAVTSDPATVRGAQRIVLPGVGSFRACYEGLTGIPGMVAALEDKVLGEGVPFLGICVGMQLLATRGLEFGETPGLGWIAGEVRPIARTDPAIQRAAYGLERCRADPASWRPPFAGGGRGLFPPFLSTSTPMMARYRGDD